MTDFNTSSLMTLDEAIKHAEERASLSCDECAEQHRQLAEWLKELRQYREYFEPLRTPGGNLSKSLSRVVVVLSIHPMAAQGFAFAPSASQSLHKETRMAHKGKIC